MALRFIVNDHFCKAHWIIYAVIIPIMDCIMRNQVSWEKILIAKPNRSHYGTQSIINHTLSVWYLCWRLLFDYYCAKNCIEKIILMRERYRHQITNKPPFSVTLVLWLASQQQYYKVSCNPPSSYNGNSTHIVFCDDDNDEVGVIE